MQEQKDLLGLGLKEKWKANKIKRRWFVFKWRYSWLLKNNPNYLICGEINEDLEELINESEIKINFYNNKILSRLAREIALISEDKFLREEFDEMTLAPNYVRKSQAEESRM